MFGRAFRGSRGQRWPIGGETIFIFKGTFLGTFALNSTGQTCSSVFPFSVHLNGGAASGECVVDVGWDVPV